ncbi:pyridoxamine 5'-phosphate oxidase family protein [Pseudoneobacillus sp. C159]
MTKIPFHNLIESEEELRSIIGFPSELVKRKAINYLDHNCKDFIAKSPFLVISTSDKSGFCDVSPRGDQPGFVYVLNEKYLVIPERPGNKRMDTMLNILSNPQVGLQFMIPGLGETLRVNGKARLVRDPELLEKMSAKGKTPLIGIGIEVEECFMHCAKAFIRSGLWEPSTWPNRETLPYAAKIIYEHANLPDSSPQTVENGLKESYAERLY